MRERSLLRKTSFVIYRVMRRNIKGFRLNRNGKPIIIEQGEVRHKEFKGASYKDSSGTYHYYIREYSGEFVYKP